MKTNLTFTYRSLNAAATLFLVVAFVTAPGVIPLVKFDTSPGTTPEIALKVFWIIVMYEFLVGTILMFKACYFNGKRNLLPAFFLVIAAFELILTFAFIDAALAYWSYGTAVHLVTVLLFCCSLAYILTSVLIIRDLVLLPRLE